MGAVEIRPCRYSDENDILTVCYRTGFMGEDLFGRNRFDDIRLFGYLFCLYYLWYQPENGFVAEDTDKKAAVGYILGTCNTRKQERDFVLKMGRHIISRTLSYTLWKHPEAISSIMYNIMHGSKRHSVEGLYEEYPAHLHINLLPEYQGTGTGSRLLKAFEAEMRHKQVPGIHLRTSSMNRKALGFYDKLGYKLISRERGSMWKGVDDYYSMIFAKKLI